MKPTAEELTQRIRRLQGHLRDQGIEGALFVQTVDRYYFSGTIQSGYVAIPAQGEALVLIRKDLARAERECPLPVTLLDSVRALGERIRSAWGELPKKIGVESDVLPAAQLDRLRALLPGVEFVDVSRALMLTRAIKSDWEIEQIRVAAAAVGEAVAAVPGFLREGMTELELAAKIEYEMRLRGHGGVTPMRAFNQFLFYGHIFAGEAAAEPSGFDMPTAGRGLSAAVGQGASLRPIRRHEPVNVDLVGHHAGYLCDQTRSFSLGQPQEPFEAAFEAAFAIQKEVIAQTRPGVKASHLYQVAVDAAKGTPFAAHFLGDGEKVTFVGHGIGTEVDEYPFLARGFDLELAEGMVFALEPKFIFRGKGVAGIEDTFVVRKDGAERLTVSPQRWTII
jgi:Xaa-Pro aminopeptidase